MKFKVGDKVKIIAGQRLHPIGRIVQGDGSNVPYKVKFKSGSCWKAEENLELVSAARPPQGANTLVSCARCYSKVPDTDIMYNSESHIYYCPVCEKKNPLLDTPIRTFETGATRDTATGKLSYMKALSPEVLEAYVTYLGKHRKQPDGSVREFDNWKLGIDKWTYLDSLLRHDKAVWKHMLGYKVSDNHGPVTFLDSLMGVIFNATGLAYELLIEEGKAVRQNKPELDRTKPVPGGY